MGSVSRLAGRVRFLAEAACLGLDGIRGGVEIEDDGDAVCVDGEEEPDSSSFEADSATLSNFVLVFDDGVALAMGMVGVGDNIVSFPDSFGESLLESLPLLDGEMRLA